MSHDLAAMLQQPMPMRGVPIGATGQTPYGVPVGSTGSPPVGPSLADLLGPAAQAPQQALAPFLQAVAPEPQIPPERLAELHARRAQMAEQERQAARVPPERMAELEAMKMKLGVQRAIAASDELRQRAVGLANENLNERRAELYKLRERNVNEGRYRANQEQAELARRRADLEAMRAKK
jgi:hypothetical protein